MSPISNYISLRVSTGEWDQRAVDQKRNLNRDFIENANLTQSVQVYHYLLPGGHAAISVSGKSYGFYPLGFPCEENSLEKEIYNARHGNCPIWVGRISIKPKRLLQLEKKLDETKSYGCFDCSEAVCRLILQEVNPKVIIPPPISCSPALTRWAWSKYVDGKNVFPGVVHGDLNGNKLFTPNNIDKLCVLIESIGLIWGTYKLYGCIF